ncbi:hypothetical protein D3874_13905 [Oleomonas cavernae]|uniref:Uncharacterized protein n=1 Tax=Oleomonas cavernae TaxID=2320859 RepID=A0A418WDB1_9PROT|nr:hypothetical protein D3874_13905 [Oleomonas cavernae]
MDLVSAIGRWTTAFVAVVGAGQALTTWIDGRVAVQQEAARAAAQAEAQLTEQFFAMAFKDDVGIDERAMLLSALATLPHHPLKTWAQDRYDKDMKLLNKYFDIYQRQAEAAAIQDAAEREIAAKKAEIEELTLEMERNRENPASLTELKNKRNAATKALAQLEAARSVAAANSQMPPITLLEASRSGVPVPPLKGAVIDIVSESTTVELLKKIAPATAAEGIELHLPYLQSAFKEFSIADESTVAAVLAEIAYETHWFSMLEEPDPATERYEGRIELGNTQAGDGLRFKARGYIPIVGRAAYTRMSARLGLGQLLTLSPEEVVRPEIAARIAVAFFKDQESSLNPYLERDDLSGFHRAVTGGATGAEEVAEIYRKIVEALPARPADYRVFVQFAGSIDRDKIREMMRSLSDLGWNVQGTAAGGERTEAALGTGEVRYSRTKDKRAAEELARQVQQQGVTMRDIKAVLVSSIHLGTLEVWVSTK